MQRGGGRAQNIAALRQRRSQRQQPSLPPMFEVGAAAAAHREHDDTAVQAARAVGVVGACEQLKSEVGLHDVAAERLPSAAAGMR